VSYNAPPTISPNIPPRIVPTKGTGIKVPRALPILNPTALAAALPTGSPLNTEIIKLTNPPIIGIFPNTLPANFEPVFPSTFVATLPGAFPSPLEKIDPFDAVFADNDSAPGLTETPFLSPRFIAASAC